MSKWRYQVNWNGFAGSPGYTHFIFGGLSDGGDLTPQISALRTFLTANQISLPNDVSLSIEPSVQVLDDNSGDVTGVDTIDPGSAIIGSDSGAYSAASGICYVWHTGVYRNSREIRGRSFFVPAAASVYGADTGAPGPSRVTSLTAAANTLVQNVVGGMYVQTTTGQPVFVNVQSGNLSPRAAILRSRRD